MKFQFFSVLSLLRPNYWKRYQDVYGFPQIVLLVITTFFAFAPLWCTQSPKCLIVIHCKVFMFFRLHMNECTVEFFRYSAYLTNVAFTFTFRIPMRYFGQCERNLMKNISLTYGVFHVAKVFRGHELLNESGFAGPSTSHDEHPVGGTLGVLHGGACTVAAVARQAERPLVTTG